MTYTPEKLLQLEFLVKTITQCRKVEDDNCGIAINVQFLDRPEQRVCEIPMKDERKKEGATSVTVVNVGKTYTFSVPDSGSSCSPKPVSLSIRLYSLRRADAHLGDPELASGELVVKTTTLVDADCHPITDDKDDMTVPLTDCQGRTMAVLSVRVRAWIAGTVTSTPINLLPFCPQPASADGCGQTKSSECCNSSLVARVPISCCSCKFVREPTSCCSKHVSVREPTLCCSKCVPVREPTPCCNKPAPVRELTSCCNKTPVRESMPCCYKPPAREPTSCCNKQPPSLCRHRCIKMYSGMDSIERPVIDQPCRRYTDVGYEINDQKMDLRVRKMHCDPRAAQRRITHEADKYISKVTGVVKDMHESIKDTVNMVD